ncbi:hypothetical protein E3P99_01404 [Wallemia hederae]|uniref:Uncharacterized protein n=1 Tax=Wallemia hederae TaxID=1540922 RepID=A0A4V4LUC4_9BASI|nr:hypothetical protein E3P99_01404 [Wallemia hederae]
MAENSKQALNKQDESNSNTRALHKDRRCDGDSRDGNGSDNGSVSVKGKGKGKAGKTSHASLTKENLQQHTRQMSESESENGGAMSAFKSKTNTRHSPQPSSASSSSDLTPLSEIFSPPRKKHTKQNKPKQLTYTTKLTPRKEQRIRHFEEIDKWELCEELVLY